MSPSLPGYPGTSNPISPAGPSPVLPAVVPTTCPGSPTFPRLPKLRAAHSSLLTMWVLQHLVAHCLHWDILENRRDGERCGFTVQGCADARGGIGSWQQDELPQQALQNGMDSISSGTEGWELQEYITRAPNQRPIRFLLPWAAFFRCLLGTKTSALGQWNSWQGRSIGKSFVTFPATMFPNHRLGLDITPLSVRMCHQLALCLQVPPA